MLDDAIVAFFLILAVSSLIYMLARYFSVKTTRTENGQALYACGEKPVFSKPKITMSLYKYLIYFVVMDSSVVLVAFASLALHGTNLLLFSLYLCILLVSGLLLVRGGD
jgi:NADH:ubiquinone oxidoreductase subunit 3 (subunit A)